ncbi:MAG TPA: T9SS type A sorting domain-containing protein, partial [Bacteroidia bacterium]|nr:T9SS type A sorting domain-containing protein [Bacteroidia bacterium]
IYAATNGGLMISQNGGATWTYTTNSSGIKLNSNTLDVKSSEDGSIVVACVNGTAYYAYPSTSLTKFNAMHNAGYGSIPVATFGRIEFAMAPSNPNFVYASVIGSGDNLIGIYMTMNAVSAGNGGNWHDIGPGGSKTFDPYSSGGVQDQGTYDNTLAVFPNNSGKILLGGTTMYSWEQNSPTDTVGQWTSLTTYYGYPGDPTYIHPDEHAIVFNKNNANIVYSGSDGGVYKSTDGGKSFVDMDRNYNVTQFYAIAFAPYVTSSGEGVMGGTQDNGTPYMGGFSSFYPQDAVDLSGGDGGQCAISSINPKAYYVSADNNSLLRSTNLGPTSSPGNVYTNTKGLDKGADIDSVQALASGCFVDPLALYENPYDTTTLDRLLWISDKAHNAGDTVYPISPNGNVAFPYILKSAVLAKGDSVIVQNRVVSKIATGFSASNYVWINMQAIDFQDPTVWMPIGGPQSKPDAFTGNDQVHCLTWSPNGDALFVGTETGQFFRFSNLDSIRDTSYITGAIISIKNNVKAPVANPLTRVISKNLTVALGVSGRDILSIAVDPKDGNKVLVTVGGYGYATNIYRSTNALSAAPTFSSAQGSLPAMPVYGSVIDLINSTYPKGAVVATEHGIYSTSDVTVPSPSWSSDNTGMANTLVCAIKQQTLPPWQCNNSGDIYIGTHGRGAYVDTTFFKPLGIQPLAASSLKVEVKVYTNPMNAGGTVSFTLPKTDKVTVTIYDVQGRIVKEIPVANDAPGLHNVNITTSDMPVGVYLATVTGTDFRQTTRFVVAR